ncbi:hypothetical protein [Streptomyces sp. NPDC051909]
MALQQEVRRNTVAALREEAGAGPEEAGAGPEDLLGEAVLDYAVRPAG